MTRPWKLKTNSSNILLVLITLILIKAEWSCGEEDANEQRVQVYIGNDDIAKFFFRSSSSNNSLILENVNECLDNFQLITCMKMLLLDRINTVMSFLEDPEVVKKDLQFFRGVLVFQKKNDSVVNLEVSDNNETLSLDEEITVKVLRMFRNRILRLNLLPKLKIDIEPAAEKQNSEFVCFRYKIQGGKNDDDHDVVGRGRKKRKGGGMSMMMMLPQLLMLGFMPFTLASLKAMVMNAVMINMMALNGAIFMTIRNLVFGPRGGDNVKYVNYGYSKDRQTQGRRPVLIIHSPAAFVKQPKVPKRPIHYHPPKGHYFHQQNQYATIESTDGVEYSENGHGYENENNYNFYLVQEDESGHHHNRRRQTMQRKSNFNARPNYELDSGVNTYQRAQLDKVRQHNAEDRVFREDQRMSTSVKSNPNDQSSTSDTSMFYRSYSEGWGNKEFRPSPQWDPIVWDTSSAQNKTKI